MTNKHSLDVIMLATSHPATDNHIFYSEAKTLAEAGITVDVIGLHPKLEALERVWIEMLPKRTRGSLRLLYGWTVIRLAFRLRGRVFLFHDAELFGVGLVLLTGPALFCISACEEALRRSSSRRTRVTHGLHDVC